MKKIISLLLAIMLLLSLCACGSTSKNASAAPMTPMATNESKVFSGAVMSEEAVYDSAENGLGMSGAFAEPEAANDIADSTLSENDPDKIIYSADATVETTAFDSSLEKLLALVEEYGGWVESSSINGANYYNSARGYTSNRSANYTLRIPSAKFSQLMNSLTDIGNVPYTYTYSENVTAQYYDVQARLTAYKTQETRLLEMMEKAETVSDVIAIEEKLTQLRYQIESLQSTINNWDRRVSYSSVNVTVQEVQEYTPEKETQISYARELWLALKNALKDTGTFFKNFLVFLVSALPTLIILTALFFALRPLWRKMRRKRAEKKTAKLEKKAESKTE